LLTGENKQQLVSKIDGVILQAISNSSDITQVLNLAEHYGKFHWLNMTDRWACPELERHIFHMVEPIIGDLAVPSERTRTLHVLSEGYDTGGHTPLCVNLIKEQKRRKEDVVLSITRQATKKIIDDVSKSCIPIIHPEGTGIERLKSICNIFLSSKYVILHIHPDDILSALAAMIAERNGVRCYFVNHADIHFCYGPSSCSSILELTWTGWLASQKYRSPKRQSFLGIPSSTFNVEELKAVPDSTIPQFPYFISVGGAQKYQLQQSTMFTDFVEYLCGNKNQKLVLVGPSDRTPFTNLTERAQNNISLLGLQDRIQTLRLMAASRAYIDSFPLGGGITVTDAIKMGLPVFGAKPTVGMYGDEYISENTRDLKNAIDLYLEAGIPDTSLKERAQFVDDHLSIGACTDRLERTIAGESLEIPYPCDTDSIDVTYYQKRWLEHDKIYIPPFIKINSSNQ
jgi:hypothetical protein